MNKLTNEPFYGIKESGKVFSKTNITVLRFSLPCRSGSDFVKQNQPQFRKKGSYRFAKAMVKK